MSARRNVLRGAHLVVGVTGSIAAYKAAALVSALVQHGARVDVVLTAGGARFVTAATFRALANGRVCSDPFAPLENAPQSGGIAHVELARNADLIVIAPATANTLARLAHGLADDLLSLTVLGCAAPVLAAPAMEAGMWHSAATQRNVELLRADGVVFAGPTDGRHATGDGGLGRMLEPAELIGHIRAVLGRGGDLRDRRIVVTAGGTREAIDPVRVLGNRSSGKMGTALAHAARDRGATVELITTAAPPADSAGIDVHQVESAAELYEQVLSRAAGADALVMAAAVADYRPTQSAQQKIKKTAAGGETLDLRLERTADVLAAVGARRSSGNGQTAPRVIVGFAAETEDLEAHATDKLQRKGADLIVANLVGKVGTGDGDGVFGSDNNTVTLVARDGEPQQLPSMLKEDVAHEILDRVRDLLER